MRMCVVCAVVVVLAAAGSLGLLAGLPASADVSRVVSDRVQAQSQIALAKSDRLPIAGRTRTLAVASAPAAF